MEAWILEDPSTRAPLMLAALGVFSVAPVLAFAAYMWVLANRVAGERQFPPSGYKVIRRVPVITGDDAIARARLFRMFAIFFLVAAIGLAVTLWRMALLLPA
jgi:hypothetical protein